MGVCPFRPPTCQLATGKPPRLVGMCWVDFALLPKAPGNKQVNLVGPLPKMGPTKDILPKAQQLGLEELSLAPSARPPGPEAQWRAAGASARAGLGLGTGERALNLRR